MPVQAYYPFRTELIDRETLRDLNTLQPWIPVAHTIVHWVVILGCFAIVVWWPSVLIAAAASVVIGVNIYGLRIVGHDGLHRRLFRSVEHNDLWNDIFLIGAIGAITRVNRGNHITHHLVTCSPEDPDRHKYVHDHKEPVVPFFAFLTGLANLVPSLRNVFLKGEPPPGSAVPVAEERYHAFDIAVLIAWQTALFGGLTYFIGWWAYPVLWLAPAYILAYCSDLIRVFCEHSMLTDDRSADESMRLVTFRSFWLERQFFAPHNMNYHMIHHLWPSIPYYNLPRADRLVRESGLARTGDERLVWRGSYLAYLYRYFVWRLRAPVTAPSALPS